MYKGRRPFVSAAPKPAKIGRQNKAPGKARFNLKLSPGNFDFLQRLAAGEGISMAAMLNQLLRRLQRQQFHVES